MKNNDKEKSNPDDLLKLSQNEESKNGRGKLKIFFGMSAGVGKTYAMLTEAKTKLESGIDVLIGVINTHGRVETEELTVGIPHLALKKVHYREKVFEEFDLEKVLEIKPQIVLVDELAHTNVPGCKHLKRWQDVMNLLDSGIDVYTTLNVQHVESRKQIVEQFTEVEVRETVPDMILERADVIELIDLPPKDLLQRLKEGKVYLGDKSKTAMQNFFKEENLAVLREVSLRIAAEKARHDVHVLLVGQGEEANVQKKMMVAITENPASKELIREARMRSFAQDMPWICVFVDTGERLNDKAQSSLNQNLALARDLGAEVVVTHDINIATALRRLANELQITQIILGSAYAKRSLWSKIFRTSLLDKLEDLTKDTEILILRQEKTKAEEQPKQIKMGSYVKVLGTILGITLLSLFLEPIFGYRVVGFLYLFGILVLSFFVELRPILLSAFLSAIAWDLFFMPPLMAFGVSTPEDGALLIIYFVLALVMGILNSRLRLQDRFLRLREEKINRLYELEKEFTRAESLKQLEVGLKSHLNEGFEGDFHIFVKDINNQLIFTDTMKDEKEKAVATWVLQKKQEAGFSTDTLPSAEAVYFPIVFSDIAIGILSYIPKVKRTLSIEEIDFFRTLAKLLSFHLERCKK